MTTIHLLAAIVIVILVCSMFDRLMTALLSEPSAKKATVAILVVCIVLTFLLIFGVFGIPMRLH